MRHPQCCIPNGKLYTAATVIDLSILEKYARDSHTLVKLAILYPQLIYSIFVYSASHLQTKNHVIDPIIVLYIEFCSFLHHAEKIHSYNPTIYRQLIVCQNQLHPWYKRTAHLHSWLKPIILSWHLGNIYVYALYIQPKRWAQKQQKKSSWLFLSKCQHQTTPDLHSIDIWHYEQRPKAPYTQGHAILKPRTGVVRTLEQQHTGAQRAFLFPERAVPTALAVPDPSGSSGSLAGPAAASFPTA